MKQSIHTFSMSLSDICLLTEAQVAPDFAEKMLMITGAKSLDNAGATDVTFYHKAHWKAHLDKSQAGACFLRPEDADKVPSPMIPLTAQDPYKAFVTALRVFTENNGDAIPSDRAQWQGQWAGFAPEMSVAFPHCYVHPDATVHSSCLIGPGAVIQKGAVLEANVVVAPGVFIGQGVYIGSGSSIGPQVSLLNAVVGKDVTIHSGCSIGQEGFGFIPQPDGSVMDIPHQGRVIIHDKAWIGPLCQIDRGSLQDTVIGENCRIGGSSSIGHNVVMESNVILAGLNGIAGSAYISKGCVLGGQVGVAGHLFLAPHIRIVAQSGVTKSFTTPGVVLGGTPAMPHHLWQRLVAKQRQGCR